MMSVLSPHCQAGDACPLPPLSISPSLLPYSAAQTAAFIEHSPGSTPSSPILHESVFKTEDGLDDRELDFPFPFCPSSPHADDALPAPQSARSPSTSLSPPYSLASVSSSSSSVSSRSSSPCLAACSCCSVARRLSALVPALKKKTRHTASLVQLYQSAVASLQSTQQQLSRAQQQEQAVQEEVERLRVAVAGKDSHIAQLRATVSKLQVEKDDRELRDRSVKELQREHDGLVRRCEKLRESLDLMQRRKEERDREEREEQQRKQAAAAAADEIDWQEEEQPLQQQQPIIIELPQREQQQQQQQQQHQQQQQSSAASASASSLVSSGSGGDAFDIARTMALAEAAMNALREELKKRNAVVKKLMQERKEWRRRKAAEETVAGSVSAATLASGLAVQEKDRKRMRKGSAGEVSMKPEELDAFAAEVQQALTAGERREEEDHQQQQQKQQLAADQLEAETDGVALRSAVVMADVQVSLQAEQQPEKRKRGRPRIHPIKEKKTAAPKVRAKQSAPQPGDAATTQSQPFAAPSSGSEPAALSEPQGATDAQTSRASSTAAQQMKALLHSFMAELASSASSVSTASPQATSQRQEAMEDVVCRMLALLCPCPCLSQSLPSLSPVTASVPFILMPPIVSTSPSVFATAAQCGHCSFPAAFSPLACCCDGSVLRWNEMISSLLTCLSSAQLTDGSNPTDAAQPYLELLLILDSRLQLRWSQAAAQGDTATVPASSLLSLFCHLATHRLLSFTAESSSLRQVETALLLLAAQRAGDSTAVRVLLHQRCFISLPSLPFAELVASSYPQLLRPSPPSQQLSSLHIKTLRLVLASMLASLPTTTDGVAAEPPTPSPRYPALAGLLSAELSSLKSASQPFVFSRLQSELTTHAALTVFASQAHFLAIATSVLSSFHLLFLFLSPLALALSVAQKHVTPSLATARSPANAALLLLTLPSLLSMAIAQLRSSSPSASATSRTDVAALKAAVSSLLMTAADAVDGRHGQAMEVRAAGVELLLRSMRETAWEGGAGSGNGNRGRPVQVVKKEDKDRLKCLVDGWLAAVGEEDAAVMAGRAREGVQVWELLSSVRAAVITRRGQQS